MKQFEYDVLKVDIKGGFFSAGGEVDANALRLKLKKYGDNGWELVNTVDTAMAQGASRNLIFIFKKEKQTNHL
jgi:hypothetical protein